MDRSIGVFEQGRFHLEWGRLDVDQDIGDLHQGQSGSPMTSRIVVSDSAVRK